MKNIIILVLLLAGWCFSQTYNVDVRIAGFGNVTITPTPPVESSTEVTIKAVPTDSTEFMRWSGDSTGNIDSMVITVTGDKVYTAHFSHKWTSSPYNLYGFQWDSVYVNPTENTWSCIAWDSAGVVAIAGSNENGHLVRSSDTGKSWTDLGVLYPDDAANNTDIVAIAYVGGNTWITGAAPSGRLFKSIDNGETWSTLGVGLAGETAITGVCWLGGQKVIIGTYPHAHLLYSGDRFTTWGDSGAMYGEDYLQSLRKFDDSTVFAGTSPGCKLLVSTDTGKTFDSLNILPEENLNGMCFVDKMMPNGQTVKRIVFAISNPTRLFVSDDTGKTVREVGYNLVAGRDQSANTVVAYGNVIVCPTWPLGRILLSTDGGETWENRGTLQMNGQRVVDNYCSAVNQFGIFINGTSNQGGIFRSAPYQYNTRLAGKLTIDNMETFLSASSWGLGNGTSNQTSGEIPSYPNGQYDWTCNGMATVYGYQYNGGESYFGFDSINDYFSSTYTVKLDSTATNFTISVLCSLSNLQTDRFLWGMSDASNEQAYMYLGATGYLQFTMRTLGVNYSAQTRVGFLSSGLHLITGRVTNGSIQVFIDGHEPDTSYAIDTCLTVQAKTYSTGLYIGTRNGSANLKGNVYYAIIDSTARPLRDIQTMSQQVRTFDITANNSNDTLNLPENVSPTITVQPVQLHDSLGQTDTNFVTASGSATLLYQWQFYRVGAWGDSAGATGDTLIRPLNSILLNGDSVRCIVRNDYGADTSDAFLVVVKYIAPVIDSIVAHTQRDYYRINCARVGDTVTFIFSSDIGDSTLKSAVYLGRDTTGEMTMIQWFNESGKDSIWCIVPEPAALNVNYRPIVVSGLGVYSQIRTPSTWREQWILNVKGQVR